MITANKIMIQGGANSIGSASTEAANSGSHAAGCIEQSASISNCLQRAGRIERTVPYKASACATVQQSPECAGTGRGCRLLEFNRWEKHVSHGGTAARR